MKKRSLIIVLALAMAAAFAGCNREDGAAKNEEAAGGYSGIDVPSPEWVGFLDAAETAQQLFITAAYGTDTTVAWISLHEKQADGTWHMVMTTPGFIGKSGVGVASEDTTKTPMGEYHFNRAFGIADDPGCAIPYVKVDEDIYWSGDQREGYHYNEMVNIKDCPDLDLNASEHIIDYPYHYKYCLNMDYNKEGVPGLGSAFFVHCFGPVKPFSGGCIAIPEDHMKYLMKHVDENTTVVIGPYESLADTDEWPDSTWPQETPG